MRFQNMFRAQLLVTGLAAALVMACSAKAQEITNTEFDDGPFVGAFDQPIVLQANTASTPVMTESQAMQAMAVINGPANPDEASLVQASESLLKRPVTALLLVIAGLLAMFILVELSMLAELKRAKRNLRSSSTTRISTRAA